VWYEAVVDRYIKNVFLGMSFDDSEMPILILSDCPYGYDPDIPLFALPEKNSYNIPDLSFNGKEYKL
jgi:hypothetical protein